MDSGGTFPFVDEHVISIDASRAAVWTALQRNVDSSLHLGDHHRLAWVLGAIRRLQTRRFRGRTVIRVTSSVPLRNRSPRGLLWSPTAL